jgi:23S rRNA (guanosine2251-2'-O)-methyltransferase
MPGSKGRRPGEQEERLIAGLQPVREAIRVRADRLRRVAIDDRDQPRLAALERFARDNGVSMVARVARAELDGLSGGSQHQGVLAWAPPLELVPPDNAMPGPRRITLALDQIQDPQNFGAIIRSAVALVQAAVVWGEHASAPLTAATFRASAGAIEHARLCRVRALVSWLRDAHLGGAQVIGLDAQADTLLHEIDLTLPTVLVVGSEHEGMARSVRRACTQLAALTPPGPIDSLNASAAAAVALYEARSQLMKTST